MDTVMGTVDVVGWSRLLVAVCDEQADGCLENSCKVSRIEERISSAREANVSNLWLIRSIASFSRES